MKKICIILLVISFLCSSTKVFAQSKPTVSLSDAIIADLALRNYLDYISVFYEDKKTHTVITINPTKQWLPASTVKLFVAMYAFDQIAKKQISLDDWVTIDEKNVVPTELETDEFPVLASGLTTTVDVLIKKMIEQSDNTAYNTLLDVLGRNNVTAYVQKLGLTHTIIGSKLNLDDDQTQSEFGETGYNINTTTAADYAKAFEFLENNKIPDSRFLLTILSHQKINNMLPAYLPTTLTIEHKTGDLDPLYHDGGIVTGNNRNYILTIFSNLGNPNILAHISQIVYTRDYALVGSAIPDKDDSSKPLSLQTLDPLVLNPHMQHVLAASIPINFPLPNITAADLGISVKDISLTIPPANLPAPTLSPFWNMVWYGLQDVVVVGEKGRQQVTLSYAKSELGRAQQLIAQHKTKEAITTLSSISTIVKQVAKDPLLSPDQTIQVTIQSVSDTQFSLLHQTLTATTNDTDRAALIHTIAQEAQTHITDIAPHLTDAKAANLSQKPLVGKILDAQPNQLLVETAGGQQIIVPISQNVKIKEQPTIIPSATPSVSPAPEMPVFTKGETIAVLGSTKGKTVVPSLILKNIPHEVAAPHPVVAVKVNTHNNTMVVSDNDNMIQVNVSQQTTIKSKDTDVSLNAIKPGSVVVVHGDIIQPIQSSSSPTHQILSPTLVSQPPTKSGQSPIQSGPTVQPSVSFLPSPTSAPSATIQPTSQSVHQPEIIRATSIQVIQQTPSKPSENKPAPPEQSHSNPQPKQEDHHDSKPAQQPPASPPSQNTKSNGK